MPSKVLNMDEKLLQERLAAFTPEPLVKYESTKDKNEIEIPCVTENENIIDLAKTNFLNVLNNQDIKKISEDIIRKYGVGTCGPRAFYGTTDVHLKLEENIAQFLEMDEAIVYSYGYVAISSSIAAYCKKTDIVFTNRDCNIAIKQGLQMAKSKVVYFDYGDAKMFEEEVAKIIDLEKGKKKPARKFLIVEGVSWKTGQILPLPEFLEVAEKYKIRIFLEESYSIGILGESGKGLLEHYKIDSYRVDMIISTLEAAIGSIGGFCAGSHITIEHQRLSGSGYIFSASLPTYLVQTCIQSISLLNHETVQKLQILAQKFHNMLLDCGYNVQSDPLSAFKVFNIQETDDIIRKEKENQIYKFCRDQGVHFILKDHGIVTNLNIILIEQEQRYSKIENVLKEALTKYSKK